MLILSRVQFFIYIFLESNRHAINLEIALCQLDYLNMFGRRTVCPQCRYAKNGCRMRATTEQKTKEKLSANDNECKGGSNWTRQMWNIIPYLAKEYQSPRYGALYILFGYKYSFDCTLHIAHGENGIVLISFYGFTPVSIAGNSWFSSNGTLASKQKINI